MLIIGIDPGPEKSAVVTLDGSEVLTARYLVNSELLGWLDMDVYHLAIEYPEGRGMPTPQSVLDTCLWCGRFLQAGCGAELYHPREVRIHWCGVASCNRSHVTQALKDKYGEVGSKKNPGPLYLVGGPHPSVDGASITGHLWDALAVALMHYELNGGK